ncbi:hypothetical protein [Lederbergia citrea]|uniref:hypothetical protein n=1 Tax=Lederbergia citrea TaxID=2833581 RepID=UPI001BC9E910|nr:hypothetical protein [Lederbergia citrea]MBS4206312.1 hypothetical protein [Lederbergia citrea]
MNNNVEIPSSLILFLLEIREEQRKKDVIMLPREIVKKYLESDNYDEEGRNFLFDENGSINSKNYLEAQKELFKYIK